MKEVRTLMLGIKVKALQLSWTCGENHFGGKTAQLKDEGAGGHSSGFVRLPKDVASGNPHYRAWTQSKADIDF